MWWRQLQSNSTAVMFEGTSLGRSVWNCIEYRKVLWNDPSDGLCLAWAMRGNSHNAPCSRQVICSLQEFTFDNAVRTLELKDCTRCCTLFEVLCSIRISIRVGFDLDEMQGLKRFSASLEFFCWSMLVRFSAIPPIQSCPKICFGIFCHSARLQRVSTRRIRWPLPAAFVLSTLGRNDFDRCVIRKV